MRTQLKEIVLNILNKNLHLKFSISVVVCVIFLICCPRISFSENNKLLKASLPLNKILDHVEKKYKAPGFSASFNQDSTLKAIDVTDSAYGKVFFKRPDKMRWEYQHPNKQHIISDGKTLWLYQPDENQVTIGDTPSFFGDGRGASFLSDIKTIKKQFNVTLLGEDKKNFFILKLIPKEKQLDISYVILKISKKTFLVDQLISYNLYKDETKISFSNTKFLKKPDPRLFTFDPPENVHIMYFNE